MRLLLTVILFHLVGVALSGMAVALLLIGPSSGQVVQDLIAWVAVGGFVLALPISYFLAVRLLRQTEAGAAAKATTPELAVQSAESSRSNSARL
jgi:hypothetical protein